MKVKVVLLVMTLFGVLGSWAQRVEFIPLNETKICTPLDLSGEVGGFSLENTGATALDFYGFILRYEGILNPITCNKGYDVRVDSLRRLVTFLMPPDFESSTLALGEVVDLNFTASINFVTEEDTFRLYFEKLIAAVGTQPVSVVDAQGNPLTDATPAVGSLVFDPGIISVTRDLDKKVSGYVNYVPSGQTNILAFRFKIKTDQPFSADGLKIPIQAQDHPGVFENFRICLDGACAEASADDFLAYNSQLRWDHEFSVQDSVEGMIVFDVSALADASDADQIRFRLSDDMFVSPRYENGDTIPTSRITGDFVWSHWIRVKVVTSASAVASKSANVNVWPNPTSDFIYSSDMSGSPYAIFNAQGILVGSGIFEQKIDCSSLKTGVYFLHLGRVVRKIIKK